MRDAEGLSLSGVGWVTGEEDKGNYSDGISVMRDESEDERVGGLVFVWLILFLLLSETKETRETQ